jgi:DNA-directed RNA polymerase subunit RPC12/RpoP
LANEEQKTRTCPYCGFKVAVEKAKKMASAKTANEASTILRRLKEDSMLKRKNL